MGPPCQGDRAAPDRLQPGSQQLTESGDVLLAHDREPHRQIWAMAGNEMLEQTLEWLFSHVLRRWNVSIDRNESLGSVMQMHDEIADAIVAGDAQQARAAMTRHVAGFQASQTS